MDAPAPAPAPTPDLAPLAALGPQQEQEQVVQVDNHL